VRDAAALAAAGNDVQARRLVAIAGRLERRRDALELADVLAAAAASLPRGRRTVALMCKTAVDEPAAAKQLARYAAAIDQARRSMPRAGQVALGHVASIKDMRADVKLLDGSIVPVLRGRLPIVGEQGVGAPVAIRWAELGSGVWMTAEAALEVPLADERIYPFERARDREPVTVPAGVLDGPATIRPSRRTTIIA